MVKVSIGLLKVADTALVLGAMPEAALAGLTNVTVGGTWGVTLFKPIPPKITSCPPQLDSNAVSSNAMNHISGLVTFSAVTPVLHSNLFILFSSLF
jgi:hypothetical protein